LSNSRFFMSVASHIDNMKLISPNNGGPVAYHIATNS
jgi:hypothetical protein